MALSRCSCQPRTIFIFTRLTGTAGLHRLDRDHLLSCFAQRSGQGAGHPCLAHAKVGACDENPHARTPSHQENGTHVLVDRPSLIVLKRASSEVNSVEYRGGIGTLVIVPKLEMEPGAGIPTTRPHSAQRLSPNHRSLA